MVTANKGPVAFAWRRLRALARRKDRLFLHEGAVMDGTPVFNFKERCLEGARILGFRGTLNSTSNHILSALEKGGTFAAALREAQREGIAEADPRHDIEGWDSALKGCALANALMGASVRPGDVRRRGHRGPGPEGGTGGPQRRVGACVSWFADATTAAGCGCPWGPSGAAGRPPGHGRADSVLLLLTDVMGEIGVIERGMSVDQTAYGLLSDLFRVVAYGRRGDA